MSYPHFGQSPATPERPALPPAQANSPPSKYVGDASHLHRFLVDEYRLVTVRLQQTAQRHGLGSLKDNNVLEPIYIFLRDEIQRLAKARGITNHLYPTTSQREYDFSLEHFLRFVRDYEQLRRKAGYLKPEWIEYYQNHRVRELHGEFSSPQEASYEGNPKTVLAFLNGAREIRHKVYAASIDATGATIAPLEHEAAAKAMNHHAQQHNIVHHAVEGGPVQHYTAGHSQAEQATLAYVREVTDSLTRELILACMRGKLFNYELKAKQIRDKAEKNFKTYAVEPYTNQILGRFTAVDIEHFELHIEQCKNLKAIREQD